MPVHRPIALVLLLMAVWPPDASARATSPDPVALAKEGSAALDARRFGDALEAFSAAATLLPGEASLCAGAGLAAFMLGRNDEAQGWFERALALNQRYRLASEWLGELHHRAGRLKEAIAIYEAALRYTPDAEEMETRLIAWRKETELQDRFYRSRGAHFTVLFEGPADEALARRTVERLEAAYWRVGETLTAYPPQVITVVLYTLEQFRDVTRLPAWTAAAYDGRIHVPMRGALEQTEELDRVLGHEFVHAVVAVLGGRNIPVWLNEGLATMLERGGAEDAELALAGSTARPALRDLHHSFFELSADDAQLAYAVSTRAVRRMIELRGASAVVSLLRDLARGAPFGASFHQRIAMTYEEFQTMIARE
jgi:tetratricopeptide (TPR) repeat protein